jgi:hypothetical protein
MKIIYILFLTIIFCSCTNRSATENETVTNENVILPVHEINQIKDPSNGLLFFRADNVEETGWTFDRHFANEFNEIDLIFSDFIKITNGTITFDYIVPNMIPGGVAGYGYPLFFTTPIENNIGKLGEITQVILKEDITIDDNITIVARNSRYEFSKILEFNQLNLIYDSRGYYKDFAFENKFWLSDGNDWQFIVKLNDTVLVNRELPQEIIYSLIYDELDETPFVVSDLIDIGLYNNYTYRTTREGTDIIIIYYMLDYFIYTPILYIIPDCNADKEYIEIGISWNDERLRGQYIFVNYRINELPTEVVRQDQFHFVRVR